MSDLLTEVSKWKLEAADEDSARYFYHIKDVESLENGEASIVVGRKGTGKTAICRYFETNLSHDRFCLKLSFKEFPFNLLYSLEDRNFTTPSQYISIWKYFIYNSVLRLMSQNMAINENFQYRIQELFPSDEFSQMSSILQKWTSRKFGFGILSLSGNHEKEREFSKIEDVWQELIPAMELLISRNIDSSKYYIVFDELDEDYRNYWDETSRERYLALITSLLKAVSNVRRAFKDMRCDVLPIVFLRDDIYELLSDPDKAKWEDHKINLVWRKENLKRMLGFRISRSIDSSAHDFDFDKNWENLVQAKAMPIGGRPRKSVHPFDYMLAITHARPRDLVRESLKNLAL